MVGGGAIAERKVASLLQAGAAVKVVSPAVTPRLAAYAAAGRIGLVRRRYRTGDLRGAFLAIAATADDRVNEKVSCDAPGLINVVDNPELANFIVPAVVSRGPLLIAVSTSGASPALARTIRKELERLYGAAFGRYLTFMAALRRRALRELREKGARERVLKAAASAEMLGLLRQQGVRAAKERALALTAAAAAKRPRGKGSAGA